MILSCAVALIAVAVALLLQARASARRRKYKSCRAHLTASIAVLVGAAGVAWIGILHPTAGLPRWDANCTWGLGAAADSCGHSSARVPKTSSN